MFSMVFKRKGIELRKVFYARNIENRKFIEPVIEYIQAGCPFKGAEKSETLFVDLTKNLDEIFSEIKKGTRYEIKRSEKEQNKIKYNMTPTIEEIKQFKQRFDVFAKKKHIGFANLDLLLKLSETGNLCISQAIDKSEEIQVYHVYIVDFDSKRARLLYSFMIGEGRGLAHKLY